jgi:hypothetical protein
MVGHRDSNAGPGKLRQSSGKVLKPLSLHRSLDFKAIRNGSGAGVVVMRIVVKIFLDNNEIDCLGRAVESETSTRVDLTPSAVVQPLAEFSRL